MGRGLPVRLPQPRAPLSTTPFEPERLSAALAAEQERFERTHPRAAAQRSSDSAMLGAVPMPWMMRWAGGFPVIASHAKGARLWDTDGHEYVDLCLGDTGAMAGHAPDPVVEGRIGAAGGGRDADAADRGRRGRRR